MIWYILGTRPEFIKAFPVIQQLHVEQRDVTVVSTGQHTSLADGMPLTADVNLGVPGCDDPYVYVTHAAQKLQEWAQNQPKPDWIVVQGDTGSALAGCRLAESLGIPLCHLEAGLRSHDPTDPWPEEGFRVEIDRRAQLKCCPTALNLDNLTRDGLQNDAFVTGNPITDALRLMGAVKTTPTHVLITLHRRESFGADMQACANRIAQLAETHPDTPFLWPFHPNPHVLDTIRALKAPGNLLFTSPLAYPEFLKALCGAHLVITDSGGVVEEATTLGIPCLIARNKTERPEACATHSILVGRDGARLPEMFRYAQFFHPAPSTIFGDGHTAPRITRLLT